MKQRWFVLALPVVPFLAGLAMDRLMMPAPAYPALDRLFPELYLPLALLFLVFLVWAGSRFARLELKKVYSFLLGNSLNIIACILSIWYFYWVAPAARLSSTWITRLGLFAQFYVLPVVNFNSRILSIFLNRIKCYALALLSSFLLLVAFSIGYISTVYVKHNLKKFTSCGAIHEPGKAGKN